METIALKRKHAMHPVGHTVWLAGLRATQFEKKKGPLIIERRDDDFVAGLLADLSDEAKRAALPASTPARNNGRPRLFQPIQRIFNVVVLESFCEEPGQPRLDPAKIESAGLVVRRIAGNARHAWLKAGTQVFGWEGIDEDIDPVFDKRAPAVSLGSPILDEKAPSQQRVRTAGSLRLSGAKAPVSEEIIPLFVAPPEVCTAAGKTLLFANLRVNGGELTEGPAESPNYGGDAQERAQLSDHLVSYLKAANATPLPLPARSFSSEDVRNATQNLPAALTRAEYDSLVKITLFVQQLHHEFDAFGTSTQATKLMTLLGKIVVETDRTQMVAGVAKTMTTTRPASDFVREAKAVLLDASPGARITMPHRWGKVDAALAEQIFTATLDCLNEQYKRLKPAHSRFETTRAGDEPHYVARAFIRVKSDIEGCPTRLIWSEYTEPYTIAPWWESSGAPAPIVPLPDLFDRDTLKSMKPNVAFALPPKLANLLRKDPKKLRDGEGNGDGFELGWICSFSLPIITLCAFIVLNIFLQLFAIIFFWLPFLKICIPFPKKK